MRSSTSSTCEASRETSAQSSSVTPKASFGWASVAQALDGDAEDPAGSVGRPLEVDELDLVRGQDGPRAARTRPRSTPALILLC